MIGNSEWMGSWMDSWMGKIGGLMSVLDMVEG